MKLANAECGRQHALGAPASCRRIWTTRRLAGQDARASWKRGPAARSWRAATQRSAVVLWRVELTAIAALIVLLNLPLLAGRFAESFAFLPGAVRAGEWWRLLTYPFVHVSWYHLLLDATAFFMAYAELRDRQWLERFGLVAAAGAGGLLAAWETSPTVLTHGLCGLSGIAHGLAAIVGLSMAQSPDRVLRRAGLATFGGVVLKSLVEAWTGEIVFASWHLGSLGTPIAVCHAGGIFGALVMWLLRAGRASSLPVHGASGRV